MGCATAGVLRDSLQLPNLANDLRLIIPAGDGKLLHRGGRPR